MLPSSFGGRHLAEARFRHLASGDDFVFADTHLVDGAGASAGREAQGIAIDKRLDRHDVPVIIVGDMNRSATLPVLGVRAPVGGTTFTKWGNKTRSTNPDQEYDHLYGRGITWSNVRIHGVSGNTLQQPRASDHFLVTATASA